MQLMLIRISVFFIFIGNGFAQTDSTISFLGPNGFQGMDCVYYEIFENNKFKYHRSTCTHTTEGRGIYIQKKNKLSFIFKSFFDSEDSLNFVVSNALNSSIFIAQDFDGSKIPDYMLSIENDKDEILFNTKADSEGQVKLPFLQDSLFLTIRIYDSLLGSPKEIKFKKLGNNQIINFFTPRKEHSRLLIFENCQHDFKKKKNSNIWVDLNNEKREYIFYPIKQKNNKK